MKKHGCIYIGTSGWMYKGWGRAFYPEGLKSGHLSYLARAFSTVEVNTSFYHLPKKSTFKKWSEETPLDFMFALKLSRYITHKKKLKGVRKPLETFVRHAKPIASKCGAVLVQLPPYLPYDERLLGKFLEDISVVTRRNYPLRFALEPRHRSWMKPENKAEAAAQLKATGVALVFAHSAKIPSYAPLEENITADLVYVRFHGPSEFGASRYGPRRLAPWAKRMRDWRDDGLDVYAYFNNDEHGHAVFDAQTLQDQVKR